MKLWIITRTDETDWDETNAILVRATDESEARTMALAEDPNWPGRGFRAHEGLRADNLVITEVTSEGKPGVIIVDFLRG